MATTHTFITRPNGRGGSDAPAGSHDLRLTSGGGRVRRTELAIGLAMVALFGLAGLLWHLRAVDRTPALALAADVQRGDTIGAADLRLIHVASDNPVPVMAPELADQLVGQTAVADLTAGTLMSDQLVAGEAALGPDDGVLGFMLEPGQYPIRALAVGDTVDVVVAGTPEAAGRAEVAAVEDLPGGERKLVSLRATGGQAGSLAALDPGTVRLVRVAP